MIASLAVKSLRNRKFTAGLTVLSIALAVMLLLGVERIRSESRASFAATVSGIDLIVGARASPVHLLLYSVFRIGNATNNIGWTSYEWLSHRPEVAWTIPISLGDSHRGFRVLGTTEAYLEHFRFAGGRHLGEAHAACRQQHAISHRRRLHHRAGGVELQPDPGVKKQQHPGPTTAGGLRHQHR